MDFGNIFLEEDAPEGLKTALARANNEPTFESLRTRVEETEKRTHKDFEKIIGVPEKTC